MLNETYLKSDSFQTLAEFCGYFVNHIGPEKGREAVPESVDEEGNIIPEQPSAGDPTKYYAAIRAPFPITAPQGAEVITKEEGSPVIGVWA